MSASCPPWPERLCRQASQERRGGHQPIRLDEPGQAWVILAGQVELFLVSQDADGARHHLASVPAGGLLLGIEGAEGSEATAFTLLAVPHVDTELMRLPLAALRADSASADVLPLLARALELWLRALSQGMARWAAPRPAVGYGLDVDARLAIPAGQRLSGKHALVWLRLEPTAATYLDLQDLPGSDPPSDRSPTTQLPRRVVTCGALSLDRWRTAEVSRHLRSSVPSLGWRSW